MSRTKSWYCRCGEYIEYGPGSLMCRHCAVDHLSGLPDLQVHGHGGIVVVLSEGRLQAVALVILGDDPEDGTPSRSDPTLLRNIEICV